MTVTESTDINLDLYLDEVAHLINKVVPDLLAHMDEEFPNECVGFIWSDGSTSKLINQARSSERFSVSQTQMAELFAGQPSDKLLSCFYHSHPAGSPFLSDTDKASLAAQFNKDLFIPWVIVTHTEMAMFWLDDNDLFRHRWVWEQ